MRKFLVKDNIIENIIEADDSFTLDGYDIYSAEDVEGDIGWDWIDGAPRKPVVVLTERQVRAMRNNLLAATDWWASSDLTMTQEQIDYRQALRDITSQEGFPENVVFPTKPE